MAGGRELSSSIPHPRWDHPALQEEHESPFPSTVLPVPPRLYQSSGFLPSSVMPPIHIMKLFQSKQLFSRSLFNAQADALKCFIL